MEQEVTLSMMLEAREARAALQQELLARHLCPLVSFTMNIAGPVKNGPQIRRGFEIGLETLLTQLHLAGAEILESVEKDAVTGCENIYAVRYPAASLKALTSDIEDASPIGRLFDMDVIAENGVKLARPKPRTCLICGKPAQICARTRAHTVEELQSATRSMLRIAIQDADTARGAEYAVRALLFEVSVSPKPGLVDRINNGSHGDMDFYSFLSSAAALWPYFETCIRTGMETAQEVPEATLEALRPAGRQAEYAMRRANGNVNTHKGAIFSLGVLCGALGRIDRSEWDLPERILDEAAAMCHGIVQNELENTEERNTAGQHLYKAFRLAGIRGEAESGFLTVRKYGLPVLEEGLTMGKSPDEAGRAALLHMLAYAQDTNMITRSSMTAFGSLQEELRDFLITCPWPDQSYFEMKDRDFIRHNLSPGGTADLLALCFMLHFLKEDKKWITR